MPYGRCPNSWWFRLETIHTANRSYRQSDLHPTSLPPFLQLKLQFDLSYPLKQTRRTFASFDIAVFSPRFTSIHCVARHKRNDESRFSRRCDNANPMPQHSSIRCRQHKHTYTHSPFRNTTPVEPLICVGIGDRLQRKMRPTLHQSIARKFDSGIMWKARSIDWQSASKHVLATANTLTHMITRLARDADVQRITYGQSFCAKFSIRKLTLIERK